MMNNASGVYMPGGMMQNHSQSQNHNQSAMAQNQTDMGIYMNAMNNRGGTLSSFPRPTQTPQDFNRPPQQDFPRSSQPPRDFPRSSQMSQDFSRTSQDVNPANYLNSRFQGLSVNNRNLSMPSIRNLPVTNGNNDVSGVVTCPGISEGSNFRHTPTPSYTSGSTHKRQHGQAEMQGYTNQHHQANTYFYSASNLEATKQLQKAGTLESPSWYLYPPAPQFATHLRTGRQHLLERKEHNSFSIDPELRQMFLNRIRSCLLTPDDSLRSTVPKSVGVYKDLTPLENVNQPRASVTFGVPSLCYKAFSTRDNKVVLLRRFMGVSIPPPEASSFLLQRSRDITHANLIPVKDMFSTDAFGGASLIFVMEYYPSSTSLLQSHMSDAMKLNGFASPFNVDRVARPHSSSKSAADLNMLAEPTVWNYFIQLISLLRYVHSTLKRACRIIDPSKVLVQDGQRIRLNCFGLIDLLQYSSKTPETELEETEAQKAQDLVSLGKLVLSVTCGTAVALQDTQLPTSLDLLARLYSPLLSSLVDGLISGEISHIDQLISSTADQCYHHLQVTSSHNDFFERQLMREMESGRIFRIMCKLQTICERNELGAEHNWSETEDRYMLKLFRDFVFHQTDETGAPWLDLVHIVSCFNKLDAGSSEKVCLVSRDSQNIVIVTYSDLKTWLDESFAYLVERQQQSIHSAESAHYYPGKQLDY